MAFSWQAKVARHLAAGWGTPEELAWRINVPPRSLRRWLEDEAGLSPPRHELDVVKRIAKLFGWPVWYIVWDAQPYPPPPAVMKLHEAVAQLPPKHRRAVLSTASCITTDVCLRFLAFWRSARDEYMVWLGTDLRDLDAPDREGES